MGRWRTRARLVLVGAAVVVAATVLAACGPFSGDELRRTPIETGPPPSVATAPERGPSVVVAAAGDISPRCRGERCPQRRTAEVAMAMRPRAVLMLGDGQYPAGALDDFRAYYHPTWGRLKARTKPVPGNHEYDSTDAGGYFRYFGKAARPSGRSYYSFDLGAWHLVGLDSNIDSDEGSEQVRWLRQDLARNGKPCLLAFWHHPRFSSGPHGNSRSVAPFWEALYRARADVVVNGHDHLYERFAPQTPAATASDDGIRQFTAGTGGGGLYRFETTEPNSLARVAAYGVLELVLGPSSYRWRFVRDDGRVADQGGPAPCHP